MKDLAKALKDIFCMENLKQRKYAEVWLSEVDFGGLHLNDKVVVNVRAAEFIESRIVEIKHIAMDLLKLLDPEESRLVWRVSVYMFDEDEHCAGDELLVFKDEG